jgi:hypothetical protein
VAENGGRADGPGVVSVAELPPESGVANAGEAEPAVAAGPGPAVADMHGTVFRDRAA